MAWGEVCLALGCAKKGEMFAGGGIFCVCMCGKSPCCAAAAIVAVWFAAAVVLVLFAAPIV